MRTGDTGIGYTPDRGFVAVGYIVRTHGLKGDVKVIQFSDNPDRFADLKKIFIIKKDGEIRESCIKNVRTVRDGLVISLSSYSSASDAELIVGGYLAVPQNEVPVLAKDIYYHYEIIGMDVLTEDGRCLGKVEDIVSTGSNDVYIVRDNNHEYLIPAIREVVRKVDTKARLMVITLIEGLI